MIAYRGRVTLVFVNVVAAAALLAGWDSAAPPEQPAVRDVPVARTAATASTPAGEVVDLTNAERARPAVRRCRSIRG
ncbi:MAG TPA: hypothetical protein VNA11_15480 [Pseudonocardia sp.]|jgi:hypothetical protein|nr:hypothetical protein [Pseudonocardia sp.]